MNRENEEQRPVPQTLCGALQKEPNCKCLVLTVLIYGCLAAVTWCRCANVTKVMVNFSKFPIRSTKHVSSPCDDGYIYIPVAFMGMLYLVYLVECYHSPIRIDLLHAESQDSVLSKLAQLKMAQPRIWWKAVSYHYVRRKRQITRYRNGDNYTTTQVYYERVNTHSATSHYYYDYCGVKDISKELILEPKIPITKIMLTKGFAFSNIRSATEFEEARSRFFAEQELSDDYMEMREGLDLGYNVNTMLVAVLGNPWFANRYVYWCLSALLLSWPLRVIIEYKTQYADYQVTKLFGVNYDTPTSGEPIHTSMSQLSQPGSYMLAPSYSEALLMEPATPRNDEGTTTERSQEVWQPQGGETDVARTDMVPSYSEALLYERAEQFEHRNAIPNAAVAAGSTNDAAIPCKSVNEPSGSLLSPMPCECHCPCPCHGNKANENFDARMDMHSYMHMTSREHLPSPGVPPISPVASDTYESDIATLRTTADGRLHPPRSMTPRSMDNIQAEASPSRCGSCGRISASTQTINLDVPPRVTVARIKPSGSLQTPPTDFVPSAFPSEREHRAIPRDISEPNLRSRSEPVNVPQTNVRSLENILENEEAPMKSGRAGSAASTATSFSHERPFAHTFERQRRFPVSPRPPPLAHHRSLSLDEARNYYNPRDAPGYGGIPRPEPRSRIMVNPMPNEEACWKLPNSRTYFCLKSILKQNNRRYTLVTADEFQNLADQNPAPNRGPECDNFGRSEKGSDVQPDRPDDRPRSRERLNPRRRMPSFEEFMSARDKAYNYYQKPDSTSPIQEVFPGDPFGGRDIVPVRNLTNPASGLAFARPSRSPVTRDFPTDSIPPAFRPDSTVYPSFVAHPSCRHERELQQHSHHHSHSRFPFDRPSNSVDANVARVQTEETPRAYRHDFSLPPPYGGPTSERARNRRSISTSSNEPDDLPEDRPPNLYRRHQQAGLTRSFTERRRPKIAHVDRNFRRSFTGRVEDYRTENGKRTNFSMETSL